MGLMFKERFIAFVDNLGFKEIVKQATDDIAYQDKVSKILNYIAKIRNDNYVLYEKVADITAIHLDANRPIYCYSRLMERNFYPNDAIYINPQMIKDFSSGEQTFCAILDRQPFETMVLNYFNKHNVAVTIANIKYSDDDVDKDIIRQTQSVESDLAYFQKSKAYEEQQERRIILGESIDSLVERKVG